MLEGEDSRALEGLRPSSTCGWAYDRQDRRCGKQAAAVRILGAGDGNKNIFQHFKLKEEEEEEEEEEGEEEGEEEEEEEVVEVEVKRNNWSSETLLN